MPGIVFRISQQHETFMEGHGAVFDFLVDKVHAIITLEGYIITFEITLASTDDREVLRDLVERQSGLVILGDKRYVGEALTRELSDQRICLMALKRSNCFHSKIGYQKSTGVS